jgi:hypothetical protein
MKDFKLSSIPYIEETKGPSVELMVEGFRFIVPASWNILVCDRETTILDTVPLATCSTCSHQALLFSSLDTKVRLADINVIDFFQNHSCYHPMVAKGTMMCHPVGPEKRHDGLENVLSVLLGPHDLYSKYLKGIGATEMLY